MRFSNRKEKVRLLRQGRKLKGTGVFINEHLTKKNIELAKHARKLRNDGKIKDTWSRNCTVFVRMKDGAVKRVSGPDDFERCGLETMKTN